MAPRLNDVDARRERAIAAVQAVAARCPVALTKDRYNELRAPEEPSAETCSRPFGTWAAVVEAAGVPPPPKDWQDRRREEQLLAIREQIEAGELRVRMASDAEREEWARRRQERERAGVLPAPVRGRELVDVEAAA